MPDGTSLLSDSSPACRSLVPARIRLRRPGLISRLLLRSGNAMGMAGIRPDLPCVTGVCARRCHVLAMRLVQSSCRLAGRFFKYSGPSQSGTCPVPDGIAGRRAARTGCPLHGSRDCPAGPRREDRQKSGKIRCAGGCGCPAGRSRLTLRLRLGDAPCPLHFPPDEFSVYSPVLGAAVQHLPDPF